MSNLVLTIGPEHTVETRPARWRIGRSVRRSSSIPTAPVSGSSPSETSCNSISEGEDPDGELVRDHLTDELIVAAPDWSLERAAETMVEGGFRHLLVVDGGDLRGVLSMRDIVRCWTEQHVISS